MFDMASFVAGIFTLPGLVVLGWFVIATFFIAYDLGVAAFAVTALMVAAGWWFSYLSIPTLLAFWPQGLLYAGFYVLIGVVWGTARWKLYVNEQFAEDQERINRNPGVFTITPPQVRNHKLAITRWMSWWPFSFTHWVVGDFFRNIWNAVYNYLATFLQHIADSKYKQLQHPQPEPNGEMLHR